MLGHANHHPGHHCACGHAKGNRAGASAAKSSWLDLCAAHPGADLDGHTIHMDGAQFAKVTRPELALVPPTWIPQAPTLNNYYRALQQFQLPRLTS